MWYEFHLAWKERNFACGFLFSLWLPLRSHAGIREIVIGSGLRQGAARRVVRIRMMGWLPSSAVRGRLGFWIKVQFQFMDTPGRSLLVRLIVLLPVIFKNLFYVDNCTPVSSFWWNTFDRDQFVWELVWASPSLMLVRWFVLWKLGENMIGYI